MFKSFQKLLLVAVAVAIAGCEGGGDSNSGPYGNANTSGSSVLTPPTITNTEIVGTWELTSKDDGSVWYIHFTKNSSWNITDDSSGSKLRVYGTYSMDGNEFQGPMINPNVGEGKIGGNISNGNMVLYFREYWHTPHKTIEYSGTKVK